MKLTTAPPAGFADHGQPIWWLVTGAVTVILAGLTMPRRAVALVLATVTIAAIVLANHGPLMFGPSLLSFPDLSMQAFTTASVVLVLPQRPLTFANSCLATADVARTYFGRAADRVRPSRLALSLGIANLLAGMISGMPVCHGAGGMTAHYGFGARTGGTPIILGIALLFLALGFGASLLSLLASFPLPILAGLLAIAGLLHIALLRDLRHPTHWALAIAVGITGLLGNLAIALVGALLVWWTAQAVMAMRERGSATARKTRPQATDRTIVTRPS